MKMQKLITMCLSLIYTSRYQGSTGFLLGCPLGSVDEDRKLPLKIEINKKSVCTAKDKPNFS